MATEATRIVEKTRCSTSLLNVDKFITKRRFKRKVSIRLRRNVRVVSLNLQMLFQYCQKAFKGQGTIPSDNDVQKLCHILDGMKPEDVGLTKDLQFFKLKNEVEGTPIVTSSTIYKCEDFELCLFFLPANAVIPLHNHPEMTVLSKLLFGTMHIKAYDLVDPKNAHNLNSPSKLRLATLKANRTFSAPSDASVLYPTSGGNIHEFTAITPCVVLDVIGPPYSTASGRNCSYYKDTPSHNLLDVNEVMKIEDENLSYVWLEETEIPDESQMEPIEYMGPQITSSYSY